MYDIRLIFRLRHLAICLALVGTMCLTGCDDENYLKYDRGYSGVYFTNDSVHYSFGTLPFEKRSYVQKIPVEIMGATCGYDRHFAIEVLPSQEYVQPVDGVQYRINPDNLVIQADSITGYIPVELLRDGLEGDDATGYTRYELRIRLVANDQFTPTLSDAEQNVVVTFDNAVEKPSWYSEAVWIAKCGEWHPLKLIKLMEHFNTTLKENAPSTYEKMVNDIGENWEKVQYGWPTDYNYTVRKYILTPTYEYFLNHPEHGITDFPNPNAV